MVDPITEETDVKELTVTRRKLVETLRAETQSLANTEKEKTIIYEYLKLKFDIKFPSKALEDEIKNEINKFLIVSKRFWNKCNRTYSTFATKYKDWLEENICIKNVDCASTSFATPSGIRRGRPEKSFASSEPKSKRRKVCSLIEQTSLEELCFATESKLRKEGKKNAAFMLKTLVSSPKKATKKKMYMTSESKTSTTYTPDEALSLLVSLKLTKNQYCEMRRSALSKGVQLYPSYKKVMKAKKLCYPELNNTNITDTTAEAKLQSLVDLTVRRLIESNNCNFAHAIIDNGFTDLVMSFKWGCDGCGSHSKYKQRRPEEMTDDSSILVSSFVPLQLKATDSFNKEHVLWKNPKPSSTSYCRPIRFRFVKETEYEIINEISHVKEQITTIQATDIDFWGHNIKVKGEWFETMVDGKICNALANNRNTQKCYICGATSKSMNSLDSVLKRECNEECLSWGLSTLHCYIRSMECLLHISYKLDVKKWQSRTEEEKQSVSSRKNDIIERFRNETGLLIDTPKHGGGNTNDGNTARRFFNNSTVTAAITGVDKTLIDKLSIILRVITCGIQINIPAFENFTMQTAKLYTELYNWYPMPVTVHKMLIHGPQIARHFLIPIGQMSEDVQESRHKEMKKYGGNLSRKMSRTKTNNDIFNNLLISSDPVITCLKISPKTKSKELTDEMKTLLKLPTNRVDYDSAGDSESDDCEATVNPLVSEMSL